MSVRGPIKDDSVGSGGQSECCGRGREGLKGERVEADCSPPAKAIGGGETRGTGVSRKASGPDKRHELTGLRASTSLSNGPNGRVGRPADVSGAASVAPATSK
jgi:hypothetical protein